MRLARKLDVNLEIFHIGATHRLPPRNNNHPIIVRVNNCEIKKALVSNSKKKRLSGKAIGFGNEPIFVDDHLSSQSVATLKEAKKLKEHGVLAPCVESRRESSDSRISDWTRRTHHRSGATEAVER